MSIYTFKVSLNKYHGEKEKKYTSLIQGNVSILILRRYLEIEISKLCMDQMYSAILCHCLKNTRSYSV